jgi:16S rRNA (guanine527-N7)-methyltransferase
MTVGPPAVPEARAIVERAHAAGIQLSSLAAEALAAHARAVLLANDRLHLTAITQPAAFFERHLGEAFEGAALLPASIQGVLLDLGSGNGYPGIPLAIARPGLVPVLAEASSKKAAFLREALVAAGLEHGRVLETRVDRTVDIKDLPPIEILATRAMGGWERIVPKLVSRMAAGGSVLIWAGSDAEAIMARASWSRLRIEKSRSLPGREQSRVYRLGLRAKI